MIGEFLDRLYELRFVTNFLTGVGFLISMFVLPHRGIPELILGSVCILMVVLQITAKIHASHARNTQNA
jgi:hypothetical protein